VAVEHIVGILVEALQVMVVVLAPVVETLEDLV
jgi:hypothetical protein